MLYILLDYLSDFFCNPLLLYKPVSSKFQYSTLEKLVRRDVIDVERISTHSWFSGQEATSSFAICAIMRTTSLQNTFAPLPHKEQEWIGSNALS
jgi:hypothetical protein